MKTTKRLFAFLLAVMMVFTVLPIVNVMAADIVASGTCGENLTWTLDSEGTLTISGSGEMEDYGFYKTAPWSDIEEVKSVKIESGVTSIGMMAFYNNSGLTNVAISDSVQSIGNNAFSGCSELESITLPNSITDIGGSAFNYCEKLAKITMSNNIVRVGQNAFDRTAYYDSSSNWADGVLYIGKVLIKARSNEIPKVYTIKSETKCIADCAFSSCVYLKNIVMPDSITDIGSGAFSNCQGLENIDLSENLANIGSDAFYFCRFKNLVIPKSLKTIGEQAFYMCKIENLTISNGVENIEARAFEWSNLKSITIPDSVTSIGDSAFFECGLESVFVPKSVKSIGNMAFGYKTGWSSDGYPSGSKKLEGFKLEGFKGSAAETYATENGFDFIALDKEIHTHSYTSKVTKTATCTQTGIMTYTCSCGDTYTKPIAKKSHTYKAVTTKATASKDGSVITKCTVCGTVKSNNKISKIKSVTLSKTKFTYNGKVQKPTVTVKDSSNKTLKQGTDYTVAYSKGCKNAGQYTVTVTFKGNYSGTKKLTFTIAPKGISISKLTAGKKQFTAKWSKNSQATGYEIQFSTSSKMKSAKTVTVNKNGTTSTTVKNLKSGKKYYVRVRTYKTVKLNGKSVKLYSDWSKVKNIKTK